MLAKIAEMPEPDRTMAELVHALVKASAPDLVPRTWYGMPACQGRQAHLLLPGRLEVQGALSTLGFQPDANLDEGTMWPTAFALTELTAADEARIVDLVQKAVG